MQQLRSRTAELVAQRLRSAAAVIARLEPLIDQAVRLGHAHRSIYEAITAGGLAASWSTYRMARQRRRKAQRLAQVPQTPAPVHGTHRAHGAEDLPDLAPPAPPTEREAIAERSSPEQRDAPAFAPTETGGTSSTTDVLAALQRARVAASKDYARIAREEYRRRGRAAQSCPSNPSPKDPS